MRIVAVLPLVTLLAPPAHAAEPVPALTCVGWYVRSPIETQPTTVAVGVAAAGAFVAPDPTATRTTYECFMPSNRSWEPRVVAVFAAADGPAVPVAGAHPRLTDETHGPFVVCERATWQGPNGSGEWWRDYDPDTPGDQCGTFDEL